jgi:hypothetical protein
VQATTPPTHASREERQTAINLLDPASQLADPAFPTADQVADHLQEEGGVERVEKGREMSERTVPPAAAALLAARRTSGELLRRQRGEDRRRWVELGGIDGGAARVAQMRTTRGPRALLGYSISTL